MKQFLAGFAAIILLGALVERAGAQEQLFVVKLHGSIQTESSKKLINVTDSNFVATGDRLVALVDLASNTVDLVEMPKNSVTILKTLLQSDHAASFGGKSTVTLGAPGGARTVTIQSLQVFGGELLLTGTVTPRTGVAKTFTATLSGIWNDSVNGDTNAPSAVFKGVITGKAQ